MKNKENENNVINVRNIVKSFMVGATESTILNDISLEVSKGDFLSIMGASGSGKSTLLYLMGGLDKPTSGMVCINGRDINKMTDKDLSKARRKEIGFIYQFYNLIPNLTVKDNIMLPLLLDGLKLKMYKDKLDDILNLVGIYERKNYTPRELSGGQQQRVAIARGLICDPDVLLADEPIGNLDSKTGEDIMKLFAKINETRELTVVQVTHSEEAANYGNRLIHVKDGVIIQ